MITRAAFLISAVLAAVPARAAFFSVPPAAYDAKAAPLDDLCKEMLTGNGYEIRDDGVVWDKIGEAAVSRTDMPYLLSRLASAKRLRALLEINNIITRYDSERKLSPEDKEAVRVLARQNWVVFGIVPRNDFRAYFSIQEQQELDRIAPRFEAMGALNMIDPPPESVTADPPSVTAEPPAKPAAAAPPAADAPSITALPPAVPPSVTALPPAAPQAIAAPVAAVAAVAAAPARIIPTLTPMMEMPSLKRESPFAVAAPAPAPAPAAVPAPAAAAPAPASVAPIAAAPAPVVVAPAAPVVVAPVAPVAVAAAPAAVVPAASAAPVPAAPVVYAPAPAMLVASGPAPIAFAAHPAAPAAPAYKIEAAPVPAPAVVYVPPPAPSAAAVVAADLGTLKAWTPPSGAATAVAAPRKPAAIAVSTAPAVPVAAVPPAPEPPKAAVVGEAEYEKFVAEGPYNAGGKAVLELIGKRAPDYCLPLLRRTVVGAVPQIVSDGARTGSELRAGYTLDAANPLTPPIVALSPGPVFVEIKKGLFGGGREAVLLPESPKAWTDLGVARPPLEALRENAAPVSTENGDWGSVRSYADGSRRGSYSSTEMAGELLEQLLLIGLSREGLDASEYAARRWARTARLMFYARLKEETQQDNFLDPDRRAELRGWLDHPDETDDLTAAVWSGSRLQRLDPRRGPPAATQEFETRARATCVRSALEDALSENARRRAARVGALHSLADAGVLDGGAASAAVRAASDQEVTERLRLIVRPPACPAVNPAREEGLRKASLLTAESTRAERMMRERKAGIESHAL